MRSFSAIFYGVFALVLVGIPLSIWYTAYRFDLCVQEGYSKTQCHMMISAQQTVNNNVFGMGEARGK